jgi:hypothetical protein
MGTSNDLDSIDEITLEKEGGISCQIDGSRIVFTTGCPIMQPNR